MVVKVGLPKVTQCGFHHDEPELFVKSQWQRGEKSFLFLLFRWALAAFFIGTLAYSWTNVIRNEAFKFWFIYMTNWGLFLCTISTSLAAFLTTFYHFGWKKFESQSISYKVFWFLSSVSTVLAFVITIVYWSILFNGNCELPPHAQIDQSIFFRENLDIGLVGSWRKLRRDDVGTPNGRTSDVHLPLRLLHQRRVDLLNFHDYLLLRWWTRPTWTTLHL